MPGGTQVVGQPVYERRFGPDDGVVNVVLGNGGLNRISVGRVEGKVGANLFGTQIAGRGHNAVARRAISQCTTERMFASAASDDKNTHGMGLLMKVTQCGAFNLLI
jgi:hypothetical protein